MGWPRSWLDLCCLRAVPVTAIRHLQVLTSQWMPFVMYGVLRMQHPPVAAAGRRCQCPRRPELSSGYYLLFFMPFAVLFGLWHVWR